MKNYYSNRGISTNLNVPRTQQQNGIAERMNRKITEKARALLLTASLPDIFWGDAFLTTIYSINSIPSRAIESDKTTFELWFGKKSDLKYVRVFGSTDFALDKNAKGKLENRSWEGILLGFELNGYKV